MKKIVKILIFVLMMMFPLLIINDYIFAGEVKTNSVIEEAEQRFFNQMQKKEANERDNILVIDTVNNFENDEYFIVGDTKISKKAAIYELINSSKVDTYEKIDKFKLDKDAITQNRIAQLKEILGKDKPKYSELYDILESLNVYDFENNFLVNIIPQEKITDSNEYKTMTTYYYYDINVGYYEDYNTSNTIAGTFTKQAEYYLQPYYYYNYSCPNSNNMTYTFVSTPPGCQVYKNIYTGNVRYVINGGYTLYPHQEVISFNYQSYDLTGDDQTAPYATITLIKDYWGIEKLYVASDVIGVPFKITKEAHYSRNQYNTINGSSIASIYPNENYLTLILAGFTKASLPASYFHQLLSTNSNNVKYTKEISYLNLNAGVVTKGSLEIVYDNNGVPELEDLVTFSFNFGVDGTYPDDAIFAFDSHWILDVYPYLIWGNTQTDANNHSSFERFVWDKDSAKFLYDPINPDYEGKNYDKNELINMYSNQATCPEDNCIGNADATEIPLAVRDGSVLLYDYGVPYFNYISDLTFTIRSLNTNFDWRFLINNIYDNSLDFSNLQKLEVSDPVNFTIPGTYIVILGLRDPDGNQLNRNVRIIIVPC